MFTAAPFSIAKTWKQPKDECIKMWRVRTCVHTHIHTLEYYSGITHTHTHTHNGILLRHFTHTHTMEYHSGIKKEQNNAICSNTDTTRN